MSIVSPKTIALDPECHIYLDVFPDSLCVRKEIVCQYSGTDEEKAEAFVQFCQFYQARESYIPKNITHPCVAQGYSFSKDPVAQKVILTMDFIPGGDLFDFVRLSPPCRAFTRDREYIFIFALAATMQFLHAKDIVYRDLKPANVMLDENLLPVLIDFGHARFLQAVPEDAQIPYRERGLTFGYGTKRYNPPEVLDRDRFEECYGLDIQAAKKIDVYMFGMVIYELLTHKMPFEPASDEQAVQWIQEGQRPTTDIDHFTGLVESVIKPAWSADPADRPSMDDIVDAISCGASENLVAEELDRFQHFLSTWGTLRSTKHGTIDNLRRCADYQIPKAISILQAVTSP